MNLGNIGGRAAASIAHPSDTITDRAGRTRRRIVPGPVPDLDDINCLEPPRTARDILLLGDGDSDHFATANVLKRFAARWGDGRAIRAAWADSGSDFNDMLRGAA